MADDLNPAGNRVSPGTKLAVQVAFAIVDEIVDGRLGPGDRLVSEPEMCAQHGVGRATVREALRLLENQGVVTISRGPGGGPRVVGISARPMAANLALYLQRAGGTFRDVMAVRMVIEPEIAALAAAHHRHAATVLAGVSPASDDGAPTDRLVAEAADFHDLVATSTGNVLFEAILLALHLITEPLARGLEYSPARRGELIESHVAIAEAIAGGDPDAARTLMRDDLAAFVRHAEMATTSPLDAPVSWRLAP